MLFLAEESYNWLFLLNALVLWISRFSHFVLDDQNFWTNRKKKEFPYFLSILEWFQCWIFQGLKSERKPKWIRRRAAAGKPPDICPSFSHNNHFLMSSHYTLQTLSPALVASGLYFEAEKIPFCLDTTISWALNSLMWAALTDVFMSQDAGFRRKCLIAVTSRLSETCTVMEENYRRVIKRSDLRPVHKGKVLGNKSQLKGHSRHLYYTA